MKKPKSATVRCGTTEEIENMELTRFYDEREGEKWYGVSNGEIARSVVISENGDTMLFSHHLVKANEYSAECDYFDGAHCEVAYRGKIRDYSPFASDESIYSFLEAKFEENK
jgi:hypothetical protein